MRRGIPPGLPGTATERTPGRHESGYMPIRQRIDSLLEQGDLQSILDLSREYVKTVGDRLGDYPMVLAQWEETNPDLLRKLLARTWDRLDRSTQKLFMHLMLNMIHRVSESELPREGTPTGEQTSRPFDFEGDEIDLDRTMEQMVDCPVPAYDSIYVMNRKKRRICAVIILDASGSMQGENLSMAAIAVASMAMNLDGRDEYGVVLFSEKVNLFKSVTQRKPLDAVIRNVLDILPGGRTDIRLGLLAGLQEIHRSTVEQKTAVLITDGQQNAGGDPLPVARRFPRLHVINLPGGKAEFSERIARVGKGHFIPLRTLFDVPKAMIRCLG